MAHDYHVHGIEKKWQDIWEKEGTYRAKDGLPSEKQNKFYGLIEFPYPSGEGLHVGHPRSYIAIDIMTRKRRMEGKNVLYPIGWDAFGLPTENFAIKHKIKPADATTKNVANFTRQIKSLGTGFDWEREVNTTDPKYYKWTQWMFLKFYTSFYDETLNKARPIEDLEIPAAISAQGPKVIAAYQDEKRMAFKTTATINWCPACKIGLANEEAQGGVCERCGGPVEKREKAQWMIRITAYAERLIQDLETVDYLDRIKAQQINWIGKSEGASVDFVIESDPPLIRGVRGVSGESVVRVFTTRPDTLFGATYLVMAPEHPLVDDWIVEGAVKNVEAIQAYRDATRRKSDLERQENKEKTGVKLEGVWAVNPVNNERIPVYLADYVLATYGTGAIMAVPAHDERDFAFAEKFELPIMQVVAPPALDITFNSVSDWASGTVSALRVKTDIWTADGSACNSGFLDGLSTKQATQKMIEWLEANNKGQRTVNYKLRDWVFSRQRYWGEPIPIIHCESCGYVPVPEAELPVTLPEVEAYLPTDTGESPLAAIESWVSVKCPHCGGPAVRETDTMPNWAGSSWYFLRYCDPHNDEAFASPEKLKFWMPVDLYNGGMEHTTLHLLYSRFWYKFLWDLGHIPAECGSEPYARRRSHAMILGEGGVKMSKSKGNVVNPDEVIETYGSDVFRTYEMFIGPFDADAPWDTNGIEGVKRFLEKTWRVFVSGMTEGDGKHAPLPNELETLLHRTIKKVGDDIETMSFNTGVSALMILINGLSEHVAAGNRFSKATGEIVVKLLASYAPHMAEELWHDVLGHTDSVHHAMWPAFDPSKLEASTFEMVIQVNGKVRDKIMVDASITEEEAKGKALSSEKIKGLLEGKKPEKILYVKGKLVSISV